MAVSGGGNRRDLRPLDQSTGSLGTHRREHEALNIPHPQPDKEYRWERARPGNVRKSRNQGYELMTQSDPEWGGQDFALPLEYQQAGLDSIRPFGDVVPMRRSKELWLRDQRELLAKNAAARGSPERELAELGERRAAEAGPAAGYGRAPVYYEVEGVHMTGYVDEEEQEG